MKKSILLCAFLILIVTAFSSCGKNKDDILEYTDVTNASGLIEKKIYSGSEDSPASSVEYKYDDYGNIISEISRKEDGTFDYRMDYEYKKYDNLFKESKKTYYLSEDKVEYYFSKYEYEKFGKGEDTDYLKKSCIQYNCDGKFMAKFEYKYDEKGNLKSMTTFDKNGKILTENKY